MIKKLLHSITITLVLFSIYSISYAAEVDTVTTFSACMKKNIKAVVIKPTSYSNGNNLPVVYLLHGYSGNYSDWIKKVPELTHLADEYNLLIICADGNFGSWYLNSSVDSNNKYETYIAYELVSWTDAHYHTIKNRTGRAITGLSMGGHGALSLSFKHQDVFGACGSMSGGVDLRPFPLNWDLPKVLGSYSSFPERWEANSVVNLTYLLLPDALSIIIDCGSDDFFYKVNNQLHEKLLFNNIPHDFISRQGGHSWTYWSNAIDYQLLFMHNFFQKSVKVKTSQ